MTDGLCSREVGTNNYNTCWRAIDQEGYICQLGYRKNRSLALAVAPCDTIVLDDYAYRRLKNKLSGWNELATLDQLSYRLGNNISNKWLKEQTDKGLLPFLEIRKGKRLYDADTIKDILMKRATTLPDTTNNMGLFNA